jgi:hypothetical protein
MKESTPAERVKELLNEVIDLFLESESIPDSPHELVTTGQERRAMRRHADRLRNGEAEVVSKNLYSRKQLIRIFEDTIRRDEGREKVRDEFFRLAEELANVIHEDPPGARIAFAEFFSDLIRQAKEDGPGSLAEARRRQLEKLERVVAALRTTNRRSKQPQKPGRVRAHDPSTRIPMIPAQIIDSPLPGETVIPIPAEDHAGLERMFIRIGVGTSSWVGRFACGFHPSSTVFMMPNAKHLFVSASGMGYILDLKSRTLVERTGTEIVGTHRNDLMTIFLVIHSGQSLEGFGPQGRLWKTEPLGSGGIRKIGYTDEAVIGEAWQKAEREWVRFSIDAATGAVRKERDR